MIYKRKKKPIRETVIEEEKLFKKINQLSTFWWLDCVILPNSISNEATYNSMHCLSQAGSNHVQPFPLPTVIGQHFVHL